MVNNVTTESPDKINKTPFHETIAIVLDTDGFTIRKTLKYKKINSNNQGKNYYGQTFASVTKFERPRILSRIGVDKYFEVTHINFFNAHQYVDLEKKIYIKPSKRFTSIVEKKRNKLVLSLNRSLHELHQAGTCWN